MTMQKSAGAQAIRNAIENAENHKPRLLIEDASPEVSVDAISGVLAEDQELFERTVPVQLVLDPVTNAFKTHAMTADAVILRVHRNSRPYKSKVVKGESKEVDARIPKYAAMMWLDSPRERKLRPLNGIASVPLLRDDGSMFAVEGYDPATGMWLENMPDMEDFVPEKPTKADAAAALLTLRQVFRTFCFANTDTLEDPLTGNIVVDTSKPPGGDESAFLHALLTAVARPSLPLAPGIIIRAAAMSGAGAGKGLLGRCISLIAFGHEPHAVTGGGKTEETEKRITAELMNCSSTLFLDNFNNANLKSDLLASVLTERPARDRLLGKSTMVDLNSSALVILTGNGLTVSEDLARRFIIVELDPRTENPEARAFSVDIREVVRSRRNELLAALLVIWRWGRHEQGLPAGSPLGSFEHWSRWVRDPLLALGCQDPALRVGEAKQRDGRRQLIAEFFEKWQKIHGDKPVAASQVHEDVRLIIDPQNRGGQTFRVALERLSNTRMAGFVLTRQAGSGKWSTATFALKRTENHRDHRGHRANTGENEAAEQSQPPQPHPEAPTGTTVTPVPPVPPVVSPAAGDLGDEVAEEPRWRIRL